MSARRVFSVLFIAACVKSNDITVRTSAIDNRSPTDTGDDYDFQHVTSEGYTQQKPGFYAVHGQADWTGMFAESAQGTRPPLPASVDFQKQMLFVATSKTPGAKSIEVQKITRTFDGLHIYVVETLTPESCPAPAPSKGPAMDIVSLDNVQFDMHVVYDRVHAESCGPPPDAVVACRIAGSGQTGADRITSRPGEMIDCDSNGSRAQTGTIVERKWELSKPPGSSTKLVVGKDNIGVTFPVDAWGAYQVDLGVRDATREGSALGVVEVLPPDAGVQLYYTRADGVDPATLPRAELHVIELGSFADCSAKTSKPFCEVKAAGALQQATISPESNKRYKVQVRYVDARLPGAPGICVRAFAKGTRAQITCDGEDVQRGKNATWELGALDLPHAAFYDARLPKPPEPAAASADAGAPSPALTNVVIPPAPPATTTKTLAPPPPTPTATSSSQIEL